MRMVAMTAEQAAELDRCIQELMRGHKNERASTLMNLKLSYQFAKPEAPSRTNVVDLHDFSRKVS